MNAGTGRQTVRDVNPDAVTLDGFDRRTVNMTVISPTMGFQSGRELMLDRLGNEMKYFYPINNFPWQRNVVRRDDRCVVLARFARRQSRFRIDAIDQRQVFVCCCACLARLVRLACFYSLGRAEVL